MSPSPTGDSAARLGILLMLIGALLFTLNDTLGKWLVATYSVGQVLLIRSIAGLLVIAPFVWRAGWRATVRVEQPWLHVARVIITAAEVYAFYLAVYYLPLADAMTYWMAAPIYVAAMSPFLLGEKVGWRRWTAIFAGFCGVLIALNPSAATLTPAALISIFGSLAFAFLLTSSRMLRETHGTTLVFWPMVGTAILGLATAPPTWVPPTLFDVGLLAVLGIVSMLAYLFVNRSLKLADAVTVVPFQYTQLFWAIVLGWLVFGDIPGLNVILGAVIIVAAGLFIFFREQKLKKRS